MLDEQRTPRYLALESGVLPMTDRTDFLWSPILNVQQFTAADVLAVSGLSAGQLKGILDRHQITLSADHNPGTGKRRMFTGEDIIALSAVQSASRVGFPLRWGNVLAQQIKGFAMRMDVEAKANIKTPDFALAFYPADDGEDWAFVPLIEGQEPGALPTAFQVLDVSREVTQTLAKLHAIVKDEPLPSFGPPQPPERPENEFAPYDNRMRHWERDQTGAWRYVGLTLEESRVLMQEEGVELDGDVPRHVEGKRHPDRAMILELMERRERARQAALAAARDGN